MAWIETIDPDDAKGELADIYERITATRGGVAHIHQASSLNVQAMQEHLNLYRAIMFQRSSLSRIMRERIGVLVSITNRCDYCVGHHAEALAKLGDEPETVESLKQGIVPLYLPESEIGLLNWVRQIARQPAALEKTDIDGLKIAGFDDRAILDASLAASYFCFVNRLVLSLGIELEEDFEKTCRNESGLE